MARQVRSEATRRKILDAAVDVFNEVGYAAADRGTIIERTGMTKGLSITTSIRWNHSHPRSSTKAPSWSSTC